MKVYAILLLFIHNIFANEAEVFNVGTVLFSPDELKKDDWSITDTGLLRARRYFQYVLPHPFLVDPSIDHFADLLLDYFTNAANIVKREETDSISTDVLSTALFDAIGGYMKSYILPVTKYGYYGGTVSKDDAQKLYQFYDDIKAYLKTDGSGWRSFDGKFQKPLKIIGNPRDYTRTTRSSCDLLAFYEETPSGFMIPLPSINFDSQSPVMFVPIKVHPLICLNSPESTNTLLNYYNAAKNCLKTRSPNDADEFDNRFRAWLTDDVIAHLDDNDQLYYALGGILTLATDNNCTDCTKVCSFSPPVSPRKPYLHINFGSKKVMILAAILFLEVVWCIPALLYMLYRRRKKKKQSDMLLFVNPNKDKDDKFLSSGAQTRSSILSSCDENTCESFRRFKKKYLREDQTPKNPKKQKKSQTTNQVAPKKLSYFASKKCSKQCATDSCEGFVVEHPIKRFLRSTFHNSSTPVFDVKSSHFAKARLFESHNNVKIDGLPIIQNIGNELPLQYDASYEANNKPVEMILNNNRQSSDEQAVIQIESYNCMERLRHSNKSIKSQQNFNEITELYKSSVDTLKQEKSIILSPTLERSQNKVNIPHRASEEEITLASESGNSATITKNIEDKATRVEFHENITMRKSEEKMLRLHKSYDNAMRIRQSHEHALLVRKSDNDARTRRKFAHVMLSPEKSKQNVINRNKSNEELCEDGKSDIKMTVQKLKNDVTNLEERNYNEKQLHTYKDNFTVQRNNVATTSGQMVDKERILAGPNNALKIIENLDKEAKTLQKSARELMHLMDDRRDTCSNPICDCTNCQKSYTEMQKLKTCATITLIADDDSSEKSEQSMKTICKEYQDTEMNHAGTSSRTLINTPVLSTNRIQTVMNTQSSLNPILRSSKLNTADVRSNAKEETKDCARNREKKNERWDKREENKSKITKKNLKKTDRKNEKIEKTVQEKDEDISDPQEKVENKVEKSKRNYRLKFTGGNKALFEVKIEKPQTTISVGIARGKGPKTSRIPTRILTDNFVRFDDRVIVWPRRPLEAPMGSKIPLPVKKTMDDIVIRHSRNMTTTPDPRLNVTL